jgi:transposase
MLRATPGCRGWSKTLLPIRSGDSNGQANHYRLGIDSAKLRWLLRTQFRNILTQPRRENVAPVLTHLSKSFVKKLVNNPVITPAGNKQQISYSDEMKSSDARSLSPQAQQALRQRVVHAMQDQRLRPAQAARLFGLHRATVGRWWKAFQRDGPNALLGRRRGRKPRSLLRPDQETRLLGIVRAHTPDQLGLPETLWTRAAVADWVTQQLGVCRSVSTWGALAARPRLHTSEGRPPRLRTRPSRRPSLA